MRSVLRVLAAEEDLVLGGVATVARSDPDRLFLTYGDEGGPRFTYGEFDARCRRFANGLAAHGLGHGDRVSVFTAGALTAAQAMFGLWRGGLVYAPVNYNLVGEALRYQLADTDPAAVVCDAGLLPALLEVADALRPDCLLVLDAPEEFERARLRRGRRPVV
ncbi:MAG TPA: AMP-binding protein, partial [Solirubrobacterales bacterium]|nr:AMP-binding protein [Solirubrobacterales bacterium]